VTCPPDIDPIFEVQLADSFLVGGRGQKSNYEGSA
jgi:hypothetical protein